MPRRTLLPVLFLLTAAPALAEGPKIALVAPQAGSFAILGNQMRDGASLAAKKLGLELALIEESCEPGSGAAIAPDHDAWRPAHMVPPWTNLPLSAPPIA